jgi:hypothetical protein
MGWINDVPDGVAVISIDSVNETNEHYFPKSTKNVLNIDFCDISAEIYWNNDERYKNIDMYDKLEKEYISSIENNAPYDDSAFVYDYTPDNKIYPLNYKQADELVKFINEHIDCDFYIHCAAGVSRSQAVVRYMLDTYFDHIWVTRKENPCVCPNIHVVRMLKRMFLYHEKEFYPMDQVFGDDRDGYINKNPYDEEYLRELKERIKINTTELF